jgi:hypothetical protein
MSFVNGVSCPKGIALSMLRVTIFPAKLTEIPVVEINSIHTNIPTIFLFIFLLAPLEY